MNRLLKGNVRWVDRTCTLIVWMGGTYVGFDSTCTSKVRIWKIFISITDIPLNYIAATNHSRDQEWHMTEEGCVKKYEDTFLDR